MFNLLELMDTEDTEDIATRRTSFFSEASRVSGIFDGKLFVRLVEPFFGVKSRDGLFGGSDEVFLGVFVRSLELVSKQRETRVSETETERRFRYLTL